MEIGIVGAGVGGLVSALLLSKQGHRVTIFEKENHLGGRLTFQGNGKYKIDQGPTIVLLPELLKDVLEEAGVAKEEINLIPCDPMYDLHFHDGSTFTKYRDLPSQIAEIERKFPGESPNFLRFLEDMSHVFEVGMESFLSKSFKGKRDFLSLKNLKLLARLKAYQRLKKYISTYFQHPKLQEAYSLQSLYIGGSPFEVPALYSLVAYSEHQHGIWYLKGGYGALIPILEKECKKQGVKIKLQSKVEEILVEEGVCRGIRMNGQNHSFDAVVFNGDFPHLYPMVRKREKKFNPSSGCVLIYLGVNKQFPERNAHQFFLPEDFEKHMKQVFKRNELPDNPSFYVFNPVSIDEEAAPPGESVLYFLIPVPSGDNIDWKRKGKLFAEQVLGRAEVFFPGLSESIEWMDIRTPADSLNDGLYQGGSFGIAPILFQSGGFRPQISPFNIKRLYSVGASVHPGGGVPIVLQGARLLNELLKKELVT